MLSISDVIEQTIRPSLQMHNGDIELVEVTADGYVKVKLTGACSSCPGAQQTLSELVEARLRKTHPDIKGVIAVHQVSDDLIGEALKILRRNKP